VQPIVRVVALGVAALVVAGCGSDGTVAPTTSPAAVAVTTSAPSTTPSTVAPASTAAPTTTEMTTTLPATTTTIATEELIKAAVQDYFEAYELCGMTPASCSPDEFTATQGPSRAVVKDFARAMAAEGLYFSSDLRGMYLVAESVDTVSPTEATATYCWYDPGIVMGPVGPDGMPTVINDTIASVRYAYGLFLEGGIWRVGRQHELERLGEGSLCPPSE
jgi:hypothetical protein